jgi:hypothetical protein
MINEEELQQRVESGDVDSGSDARAYEKVFRALRAEMPVPLSISFADNVIKRVVAKQRTRLFLEEYLIIILSVTVIMAAGAYAIAMSKLRFNLGFLTGLSSYAGVIGFGLVLTILLNLLERKLLSGRTKEGRL